MNDLPPMERREPTTAEWADLGNGLYRVAWEYARGLADLDPEQPPHNTASPLLDMDGKRAAELAQLSALRDARVRIDELIAGGVNLAGQLDAGGPAIAAALGVTPQAIRKRWPDAVPNRPGPRPRLTIGTRTASSSFAGEVLRRAGFTADAVHEAGGGAVAVFPDGSRLQVEAAGRVPGGGAWWTWTMFGPDGQVEHADEGGESRDAAHTIQRYLAERV